MDDHRLRRKRTSSRCFAAASRPRVVYLGTASVMARRGATANSCRRSLAGIDPVTLPVIPYDMKRDYAQAVIDADPHYVVRSAIPSHAACGASLASTGRLAPRLGDGTVSRHHAGANVRVRAVRDRQCTGRAACAPVLGCFRAPSARIWTPNARRQPVSPAGTGAPRVRRTRPGADRFEARQCVEP
jgi:hypothetical protein